MNNLDTKRLTNLLNWDIKTYKKDYTTILLATFGALLSVALVTSGYLFDFTSDYHFSYFSIEGITTFATVFVMCAMIGVAGRAFQHMMTNQERIAYMMLPASTLEKYLVRVVFRTFLMFILIITAVIAADYIFGFLLWIRTGEFVHAVRMLEFIGNLWGTVSMSFGQWVAKFDVVFLIWSFFILGSVFFRRRAVLMTFLTLFAAGLVFSILMGASVGYIIEWMGDKNIEIEFLLSDTWVSIICNLIVLAWLSFNLWYSYRLFSRMQVINNRWNNK